MHRQAPWRQCAQRPAVGLLLVVHQRQHLAGEMVRSGGREGAVVGTVRLILPRLHDCGLPLPIQRVCAAGTLAAFAHRTTHGGPYRYLHLLATGDQFTLTTSDGRVYTYEVVRRDLTDGRVSNILAATRFHPGTTFSLIACSRTDFTPTSTSWRIVVTGALIGWRPA